MRAGWRTAIVAPGEFAALAEELRNQAGHGAVRDSNAPPNNVVAFEAPRVGPEGQAGGGVRPLCLSQSLANGLEPNIEEMPPRVAAIPASAIASEPEWMKLARGLAHKAAVFKKSKRRFEKYWTRHRAALPATMKKKTATSLRDT